MPAPRFLTLTDVAEVLNTSSAQVYALVRRKELKAIKIGGRGQWRVEDSELEAFIQRMYDQTDTFIDEHPFEDADLPEPVDQGGLADLGAQRDRERELLVAARSAGARRPRRAGASGSPRSARSRR